MSARSLVDELAEAAHEGWMAHQRSLGITSRAGPDGEEYMAPWAELSEAAKERDRVTVRAVLDVLRRRDMLAEGVGR